MSNYMLQGREINGMKVLEYTTRGHTVMAVAYHKIYEGVWTVYLKDVPGVSHHKEIENVVRWGYQCEPALAKVLFPRQWKWAAGNELVYVY